MKLKEINGKFYQECEVVMLPNIKSRIYIKNGILRIGSECLHSTGQHLYFLSNEEIKDNNWCVYNYNETIILQKKNVDRYGHIHLNGVGYSLEYCKKIIATTDSSLLITPYEWKAEDVNKIRTKYPQPSESFITKFIKSYNEGNPITKVLVEYNSQVLGNGKLLMDYTIKVDKSNEITIIKQKDSWNREEVIKLLKILNNQHLNPLDNGILPINEWIEQNL